MNWSDVPSWLPLALSLPVAGGLALIIKSSRSNWSNNRVAFLAALPGSIVIISLGLWAFIFVASQPSEPGEIDAGGMALAAIMFVTPAYGLTVLVIGMLAARSSIRMRNM